MSINKIFPQVAVADLAVARAWYERLFGRPADANPMEPLIEWHFPGTGGLQLVHDAAHAGQSRVTMAVDDLGVFVTAITDRGLPVGEVTRGEQAQFANLTDPEGNTITIAALL